MVGAALQSPNCSACRELLMLERLTRFITAMHEATAHRGKLYVHRAWQPAGGNGPQIHDDPATYLALSQRLPKDEHLLFSFKVRGERPSQGGTSIGRNGMTYACLLADERPKWIEFQCEREFEGKGAFPNYQGPA